MNSVVVTEEDVKNAQKNPEICSVCKKPKQAYLGRIFGSPAVLWKGHERCEYKTEMKRLGKSDKQIFEELQTPFWKLMGLKPKPEELKLERYLKNRGMTYADWRRERDYKQAKFQSALPQFQAHVNKYGTGNVPDPSFGKKSS